MDVLLSGEDPTLPYWGIKCLFSSIFSPPPQGGAGECCDEMFVFGAQVSKITATAVWKI